MYRVYKPLSLGPAGCRSVSKPDGGSALVVLGIGPWPSLPGRDADAGVVEVKVLGWVSPEESLRQGLGAESPFGR